MAITARGISRAVIAKARSQWFAGEAMRKCLQHFLTAHLPVGEPRPQEVTSLVPTPTRTTHHHGNLRAALVQSGIEMLEAGETFSLRAVARHVGVSQTAPYRHFSDKEHLEAAMAAQGFRTLQAELEETVTRHGDAPTPIVELALTYTRYAVANPALYHLMFGQPCGDDDERLTASAEVFALIERVAGQIHPTASPHGLATAGWALAHGLASLYLDGKLVTDATDGLDARVREAFGAVTDLRTDPSTERP